MKDDDVLSGCGWLLVIAWLSAAIAVGIGAHNFWIGLGAAFSLSITIGGAFYYVMQDDFKTYAWTAGSFVILLGLFVKYGAAGRWWWILAWLLTMFSHGIVGMYARERDRRFHSIVAGILALLSLSAGLTAPEQMGALLNIQTDTGVGALPTPSPSMDKTTIFWVWITLVPALMLLGIAWYQGYKESEEKNFASLAGIGFILLLVATLLSKFEGGWWWTLPWVFAALVLWHAGQDLRQYSFGRGAGNFGVFLAVSCLLIGIGGPYLASRGWSLSNVVTQQSQPAPTLSQADMAATQLANAIQTATAAAQPTTTPPMATASPTPLSTTTPAPTVTPNAPAEKPVVQVNLNFSAAWQALGAFLLAAVKSVWGIFHLVFFALLGYSWFRRAWGALLLPTVLLLAVSLAGALSSPADEALIRFISSSPAGWMRDLIRFSVEKLGHAGWGTSLLGVAVSAILLPILRQIIVAQYRLRNLSFIHRIFGSQIAYDYIEKSGANPFLMMVNFIINPVILLGLFVALWVALRQEAHAGGVSLAAWGIPDLSLPSGKPIWQFPYFILGAVLTFIQITLIPLKRKFGLRISGMDIELNPWSVLAGTFILTLFVPAGVLLFLAGQIVFQWITVPTLGRDIAQIQAEERRREEEERRKKEIEEQKQREEQKRREEEQKRLEEQEQRLLQEQERDKIKGEIIWVSPTSLNSILALENLYCLAENGALFRHVSDSQKFTLPITQGQALFAFKEDQLLVLGNGKDVLWVAKQSGEVVKRAALSLSSDKAVLNPYQTMLAWVNTSNQVVNVLALESGKEFTLLSGVDLTPVLAFSADGRYVAAGDSEGNIHIIDFPTRKTVAVLPPPESSQQGQSVRAIYGRKTGGWVAVYADRQVLVWDASNQPEKKIKPARKILAMDYHTETGRLALGMSNGTLQVFDQSLSKLFDEAIQEKEITAVCFSQDGRQVFTIGNKTEVRRVDL